MMKPLPDPPDHIAIDADGHTLPFTPTEVAAIVQRALQEGDLIAALVRMPSGDLAFQVLGEPSEELAETLEQVARAYRVAIRGH